MLNRLKPKIPTREIFRIDFRQFQRVRSAVEKFWERFSGVVFLRTKDVARPFKRQSGTSALAERIYLARFIFPFIMIIIVCLVIPRQMKDQPNKRAFLLLGTGFWTETRQSMFG